MSHDGMKRYTLRVEVRIGWDDILWILADRRESGHSTPHSAAEVFGYLREAIQDPSFYSDGRWDDLRSTPEDIALATSLFPDLAAPAQVG